MAGLLCNQAFGAHTEHRLNNRAIDHAFGAHTEHRLNNRAIDHAFGAHTEHRLNNRAIDHAFGAHTEHHPAAFTFLPGKIWQGRHSSPSAP